MYIELPYTLFYDPQAAVPADFCRKCGCECYAPELNETACTVNGEKHMSLSELSAAYEQSAQLLRQRLRQLRQMLQQTDDPEVAFALRHRIGELAPLLTEMNDLAELTRRYYERGYRKNEKYTL